MNNKLISQFNTMDDLGINKIPNKHVVYITSDDNNQSVLIQKISNTGLNSSSTIRDFLNDTSLYKPFININKWEIDALVNNTIGGIQKGDNLLNLTQTEILEKLFYSGDNLFIFNSFYITGQAQTLTVGENFEGDNITFEWNSFNTNDLYNTITITDVITNTIIVDNLSKNINSFTTTIPTLTYNSQDFHTWKISGFDSKGNYKSKDFTIEWLWDWYYGSTNVDENSLTNNYIKNNFNKTRGKDPYGTYEFPAGYKYLLIPNDSRWETPYFYDNFTNLNISMIDAGTITLANSGTSTSQYKIFRSKNLLNDTITIDIKDS